MIRKRKIEEKVRSFALREDEEIQKATNCQQGEAKRSRRGSVTVHCSSFSFVWKGRYFYTCFSVLCVIAFHKVYVAMLWIDRRLCIFSKFCKGECWCYRGTQRKFFENIC